MSDIDFSELANVKVGDVKPPVLIPIGHYRCQFSGQMKPHKAKSGNLAMRFPFKVVGATDDVDAEQLEAAGGIPDKEYYVDFWMSPDARFRFTDFGKGMGGDENMSLTELAEHIVTSGNVFIAEAKHVPNQDADKPPYLNWDNFVAE